MSEAFKTHLLLQIGELLQTHLPGISDIKLYDGKLLCNTEASLANVLIEVRVRDVEANFEDAVTMVDPLLD